MSSSILESAVQMAAHDYQTSLGPTFEPSSIAYATGQAFWLAGCPQRAWQAWVDGLDAPSARGWPVMMNALMDVSLELGWVQKTADALAQHADRISELHLWIGVLASRAGDPQTAERAFANAEATTEGTLRFTATTERLRMLLALQQLDAALAVVSDAIAQQPNHAVPLRSSRAGILNRLGRPAEALTDLDAVLNAAPGFAPAWLNRGSALIRLNRPDEAKQALAQAVALDPTLDGPARLLFQQGESA